MLKPDFSRTVVLSGVLVAIVFVPLAGFTVYQLSAWGNPAWVVWGTALFEFVLANVVWRVVVYSELNYGIVLNDEGIDYYARSTRRHKLIRRRLRWKGLHDPIAGITNVVVVADGYPMRLSYDQARIVLADGRCPIRGRDIPNIARRIGLTPDNG